MHIKKGDENLMSLYYFPDNFLFFLVLCALHYIIAKAITYERLSMGVTPFSSKVIIVMLTLIMFIVVYIEVKVLMLSYNAIVNLG